MVKRYGAPTILAVAATVFIWSTTFASLRATLGHFSPGHLVFLRWWAAAAVLVVYGIATGMRLPARRDLPAITAAGLLGFTIYQIALANGQVGLTAGSAGFLINLGPMLTTLLAAGLGQEKTHRWTWIGLAVSTFGVVLLGSAKGGFGGSLPHAGLVLVAAASFAGYVLVSKPLLKRYRPIEVTTYAVVAGALPFVVWAPGSLAALSGASTAGILSLAYMALVPGAISYVMWSRAVAGLPAGMAARFLYAIPVLGLGVAWLWLGEVPSLLAVAGGLVSVVGVAIAARPPRPRALPAPSVAAIEPRAATPLSA